MVPTKGIEPLLDAYKATVLAFILSRHLVVPIGIEPMTQGSSNPCSTN